MVVIDEKKAAKLEANRVKRHAKYEAAVNEGWKRVRKLEEILFIYMNGHLQCCRYERRQQRDF